MGRTARNLLPGALLLLGACTGVIGSGTAMTDSREITEFSAISVGDGLEVVVEVGKAPSVVVSGDDNVVPVIDTVVDGEVLKVEVASKMTVIKQKPLLVTITTPTLNSLKLGDGSKAEVAGVDSAQFAVNASDKSQATVAGKATSLNAEASGSSKLDLSELLAQTAQLTATGSSKIQARVYVTAQADASGGSEITVTGGAQVTRTEADGASVIVN